MPNTKPDLVLLYTCPLNKADARLCYWLDAKGEHPRVIVEHLSKDAVGEPSWAPMGFAEVRSDVILSHLLWHIITQMTPKESAALLASRGPIDLRSVAIPMAPL